MHRLSAVDRHRTALERLRSEGYVPSSELAAQLGVSEMTVRRDFQSLEADGLGRRVAGGLSLPRQDGSARMPFVVRADAARVEKEMLARSAAEHLPERGTVALDAGTTVLPLASMLNEGVTCVTPSLPVTTVCAARSDVHLISPGGDYAPETESFVGPLTNSALENLAPDVAVLGAAALGQSGLFSATTADAQIKRTLIRTSRAVIVLCDDSKLARSAPVRYADFSEITRLLVSVPGHGGLPDWLLDEDALGCTVESVEVPR